MRSKCTEESIIEWFVLNIVQPEILGWFLSDRNSDNAQCIVWDPFMGTGTTGVVCSEFGVKFIGSENDQQCFEKAYDQVASAYYFKFPELGKNISQLKLLSNSYIFSNREWFC